MSAERPDRAWAAERCDGWPPRTVFDRGMPAGVWEVCPEPVVVVMLDTETNSYAGLCRDHLDRWRETAR